MEILKISEKHLPGEFQFHSLKVDLRTQNKADVLKCFAELGFYVTSATSIIESDEFLFVQDNGRVFSCENAIGSDGYSWVNLRQLEDMVIINRNDVNDANHTDQDGWKWFLTSNGDGYVFAVGNAQQNARWDKSPLDHVDLKPILNNGNQQSSMVLREYLDPENSYQFFKSTELSIDKSWIEIPEDAHLLFMEWFYKLVNGIWLVQERNNVWIETEYQFNSETVNIYWLREGIELPKPVKKLIIDNFNYQYVDGIAAAQSLKNGFEVDFSEDEEEWDSFNLQTGFRVGCLLGEPNQNNQVVKFRVIPKTLKIIGIDGKEYEFPTPIRQYPPKGTVCFIATLSDPDTRTPQQTTFSGNEITKMWVDHRRLHFTAEAALAHIEAEVLALGGNF
ncbi:hypothetical protein [Acinetobacter beijerinckii]|uniref:hypothetical protein n=1 Tax=Acinetobacter beijerinckii TaxID=262668 RepID=UPI00300BD868